MMKERAKMIDKSNGADVILEQAPNPPGVRYSVIKAQSTGTVILSHKNHKVDGFHLYVASVETWGTTFRCHLSMAKAQSIFDVRRNLCTLSAMRPL
jgi:hypothetical protein